MTDTENTVSVPPAAAISGSGRSGTNYIAEVLKRAIDGVTMEKYWSEKGAKEGSGSTIDVSWLASRDEAFSGLFYHQVRHPLFVVSSLAGDNLFKYRRSDHYKIRVTAFEESGEVLLDAMRCYLAWFRMAERRAMAWWRVEDVNADLVMRLAWDLGIYVPREDAQAAVDAVDASGKINYHGDKPFLSLADLPDPKQRPATQKIADIMAEYGYEEDGMVGPTPAGAYTEPFDDSDLVGVDPADTPQEEDV